MQRYLYENQIPNDGNQDYKKNGRAVNAITLGIIMCDQNVMVSIWKPVSRVAIRITKNPGEQKMPLHWASVYVARIRM